MAASKRETILKALKTCLEGITKANGYAIQVKQVRRGIHFEDQMPNRPALGFTNTRSTLDERAFGETNRILTILIYGYVDVEPGQYDALDDLMQAVEQRLQTEADWDYWESTDLKDYTVYEGGAHDQLGYFDLELEVGSWHDIDDP